MISLSLSHFCLESCLGSGITDTLQSLRAGQSGLRPCAFESVAIATYVGMVDGLDSESIGGALADYDCRNNRLARRALAEEGFSRAVAAARLRYGADRIGVFVGTSTAGIYESEVLFRQRDAVSGALPPDFRYRGAHNTYSIADFVQRTLKLRGPALSVSAACASTAKVFGVAARMIEVGLCDAAVVGGADTLCLTTLYGFQSLQLTAVGPCRPFDEEREGISIGEAAGFALLERVERSVDGNGIVLVGVGESSDAYHMSSPHPEGVGALRAMDDALAQAGLTAGEIDYVNVHGTGTKVGDSVEDRAVSALFGRTPCSSTKGLTGHTLGASGIVEAIISSICMQYGFIPSSPATRNLDRRFSSRYIIGGMNLVLDRVMSNSFGFGGSNCSIILRRAS